MHSATLVRLLLALAASASAIPTKRAQPGSAASIQNFKDKIKNVVVLVMENRSLDNLLGGQTLKGLENPINSGPYCNPYNLTAASEGNVCSAAKDYDSVSDDPDHGVYGNNLEFYGTFNPDESLVQSGALTPSQNGFVHEQIRLYASDANRSELATQVMNYYTEEQVPVLTALVQNFLTFNHWHSDVPGPTNPNRAALVSGTTYGHGSNDDSFTEHAFPQVSIWQALTETNHTWLNYWDTAGGTGPDAGYFNWTYNTGNQDKIVDLETFYTDAAAGTLPELAYINPSCCGVGTNSMHPSGLVSDGEALIRRVYDAARAGPQWKNTLFVLSFDETGGFHDHDYTFTFNRLGGRIPTLLISDWVSEGYVEQQGTNAAGETVSYSATSILRSLGYLWGFEPFNPRVEHAPSFDHLIQTKARNNTPTALPTATPFKR
ncbi:phosphoesterase superfamily protein [Talaromyces proteolyticus]|uniref:Phosphoesterase superfamily protein n=1 Tax=Talaromyces proteolyticus TaxID=1131652 RepID=A0AAD4PXQ2_9EURO|nr:phosphoesterase superfamily protein [Talaromyces proteolyticus]KAH8693564.1 phosphoesterase superfamily protein [Talaromyces proteolyticus]